MAVVNGPVTIGEMIFVAQGASIRGDEGQPIFVGDYSNVQMASSSMDWRRSKATMNCCKTKCSSPENSIGSISESVFPAAPVTSAWPGHGGRRCLCRHADPGVSGGTRYVPALALVTTQEQADALPAVTAGYAYRNLNEGGVKVNVQLAKAGQPKQINR